MWRLEFAFRGNPVSRIHNKVGACGRKTLHFTYEVVQDVAATVDKMLQEWTQMVKLFDLVDGLEAYLEAASNPDPHHATDDVLLSNAVSIRTYTFEEVTLEYGPGHRQTVRVRHDAARGRFGLTFGGQQELAGMCPHSIVKEQLEDQLNSSKNLALLAKVLHETYSPLRSVCRLPNTPQLGVSMQKANHPAETFVVVPQSPTHLKVAFVSLTFSIVARIQNFFLFPLGHILQHILPGCTSSGRRSRVCPRRRHFTLQPEKSARGSVPDQGT